MKRAFVPVNLSSQKLKMPNTIETIAVRYKQMGYKLILRQLYYQLVSKGTIPNKKRRLCKIENIFERRPNDRSPGRV
ncbi:hypothetical protein MSKOL_1834 [Methanosarcina sp. Kolksee]|uniref:hypothetical protein n=1 Tax=Methanosarcina sp. Kolksee TaxID=1434099 RepID=UPI000615AFC0|nr:hypothetical protein [Methanosarcina sp. Kolksee]AKB47611.1 hypothetical protein MSKOL_1834 [Methanosarcina sp. Kolksee]